MLHKSTKCFVTKFIKTILSGKSCDDSEYHKIHSDDDQATSMYGMELTRAFIASGEQTYTQTHAHTHTHARTHTHTHKRACTHTHTPTHTHTHTHTHTNTRTHKHTHTQTHAQTSA